MISRGGSCSIDSEGALDIAGGFASPVGGGGTVGGGASNGAEQDVASLNVLSAASDHHHHHRTRRQQEGDLSREEAGSKGSSSSSQQQTQPQPTQIHTGTGGSVALESLSHGMSDAFEQQTLELHSKGAISHQSTAAPTVNVSEKFAYDDLRMLTDDSGARKVAQEEEAAKRRQDDDGAAHDGGA